MRKVNSETGVIDITIRQTIIITALIALAAQSSLAMGLISVVDSATVTARTITVGDIASISGITDQQKEKIASLSFDTAPPPDRTKTLNARQIKGRLYNAGVKVDNFKLDIPDQISIHREATIVKGEDIMAAARQYLRRNMIWNVDSVEIAVKRVPRDITLEYGEVNFDFVMDTDPKKYGVQNFRVLIKQNGETVRIISLATYFRIMANVVVAAVDMEAGHVIGENDLTYSKKDLGTLRPGAYDKAEPLIGKRVFRLIGKGELITHTNVEEVPDINTGDMVNLVIRGPSFEISAQGKALHKGYIGDTIKVLNIQSRKVLHGLVVDSSTVAIIGP